MKVFHITSVHPRYDTRIFHKECKSLVAAGFDVSLVVCDGLGSEISEGVRIIDAGNYRNQNRAKRMLFAPSVIDKILRQETPDVIHFHDPELLILGRNWSKKGSKVIYDAHENVPKQILSKPYFVKGFRELFSRIISVVEKNCVKKVFGIVTVTEDNVCRLKQYNQNTILVRNFPILSAFSKPKYKEKNNHFIYVGGITKIRGALELAEVALKTKITVDFYGPIESSELENLIKNENVIFHGVLNQKELYPIIEKASVGFVILHKVPNYLDSYPIKLFEYMASGLAIIASNIPMWKEIIDKYRCGLCVDPCNVLEICNAVKWCLENPDEVKQMGINGRNAVEEVYNWENESKKLITIYESLRK